MLARKGVAVTSSPAPRMIASAISAARTSGGGFWRDAVHETADGRRSWSPTAT